MAGRKLSFDPQKALDDMMVVFWEKGFKGTSIDDLCQVVGVPKPSIYSTFGNKETILISALEHYSAKNPQNNADTWKLDLPFKERLVELMVATDRCDANPGRKVPSGCLMVNTIAEFMGASERVDEAIRRLTKRGAEGVAQFFEHAQQRGELKKGHDVKVLSNQVSVFITGLSVMRKAGLSRRKVRELSENFVSLIL